MATVSRNLIEILIRARDEASKELKKSGDNVAAFEKRIATAGAAMAATGAAMIAAVSGAAIAGGRYADSLDDLSSRTLVSRETLAALGTQLTKNGGSFEDAEVSVRTFSRAIIDAVSGQQEAIAQFERLGISVDDLVGPGGKILGFEELLPRVADGFSGLRDEAARLDSAVALFGRSATSLVPILSRGSVGIAEATEEARKLNTILGGGLQSNAGRLGDRMDDLKLSVLGMNNALAGSLDPTLGRVVSGLAAAAQAAGEFAEANPALTRTIVGTTAALAGLAAAPATIALLARAVAALRLQLVGGAVAAGVFGKSLGPLFVQGRTAAGAFTALRATTLGWAAGLGVAAAAVVALTAATGALVAMQQQAADRARSDDAAAKQHTATLKSETASIQEQAQALQELRDIRGRQAVRETRASLPTVGQRERVVIEEQSRQRALAEFDRENAAFAESIRQRAARVSLGIPAPKITIEGIELPVLPPVNLEAPDVRVPKLPKITVDSPEVVFRGPTLANVPVPTVDEISERYQAALEGRSLPAITIQAPPVKLAPIDENDLNGQIARQRQIVERAQEELSRATRFRAVADRQQDVTIRLTARTGEEEATNKLAQAEQRLLDMQRQSADRTRDLARAAAEATTALRDFDVATGRISVNEAIEANSRALDESVAVLQRARDVQAGALPGTIAYENATKALTIAIDQERDARSRLASSVDESNSKAATDRQLVQQQADAVKALTQAQQDLNTVLSAKDANVASYELEIATLQRLKVAMEEAQAAASTQAGPVPPERFQQAADSTRAFADATLQARQSVEELGVTFDASGLAVQQFGGLANAAMSAIGGGAVDAAQIAKGALASIIQELIRTIATAKLAKAAIASIGGFGLPIGPFSAIPALLGMGRQEGGRVARGIRGVDSVHVRVGRGESIFDHRLSDKLDSFLSSVGSAGAPRHQSATELRRERGDVVVNQHFHGVLAGSTSDAHAVRRKTYEAVRDYQDTGIAQPRFA